MYSGVILVLKGVSLQVGDQQIVALVGSNGAGKSTTVKAISGLLHVEDGNVTGGTIEFNGARINEIDPTRRVKSGLVSVMEGRKCLEHLTVESCLRLAAHLRSDQYGIKKDLDMVYQVFPLLKRVRNQVAGYLSGGERQMLVIGQSIMAAPQCMILDEPSQGLAPKIVHEIFEVLKALNKTKKVSMLMVEQNVRMALRYADYGYVMENGRIVLDGSANDLAENEDLKEFYLGMSVTGKRKSYRDVKHYKRRKRWAG
jgi:branched-chain amino acid transport system ATP-binding protein